MGSLGTQGEEGRLPLEPPRLGLPAATRLEISESPAATSKEQGRGLRPGWLQGGARISPEPFPQGR